MGEVLEHLGAGVAWEDGGVVVDATHLSSVEAPYELVRRMRASIVVLGPLLARHRRGARGDAGRRQHRLATDRPPSRRAASGWAPGSTRSTGSSSRRADGLTAASITLDYPSVGATENLMMAAVTAEGVSVIDNAAREPEIADLARVPRRRWGRGSTAPGPPRSRSKGVEALRAGRAHGDLRPDRGRNVGRGRGRHPRRHRARRRAARPPGALAGEARRGRRRDPQDRRWAARPAAGAGPGCRLRDAAVPGDRDGLPADPAGDARDGERDEHRDRERLRGAIHCTSTSCGGWAPTSAPRDTTR